MKKKITSINTQKKLNETTPSIWHNIENLSILERQTNNEAFDIFAQSIWNDKEKNEILFSEFLNEQNLTPYNLWDIKININNIDTDKKLWQWLQYLITNIFIKKLYELWKNNPEFLDTFNTNFGDIENIKDKKVDLKSLKTLLSNYDEKYTKYISISNKEIFEQMENLSILWNFKEQTPTNQKTISELICRELSETINKFNTKKRELYSWAENLLTPNKNFLKNLFTDSKLDKSAIEKLEQEREHFISQLTQNTNNEYDTKDREKVIEMNKNILNEYIKQLERWNIEKDLVIILKKLVNNNFNFDLLNNQEKTLLAHKSINSNKENLFASMVWVDVNDYEKFLDKLYDFDKQWETETIPGVPPINIKITKEFEVWEHIWLTNLWNLKDLGALPMKFTINIDDNDEDTISMIESPQNIILSSGKNFNWIISTYHTKSGELRIWNKYLLDVWGVKITWDILDELSICEKQDLPKAVERYWLWKIWKNKIAWINCDDSIDIIKELLKDTEVKILERNLEFNWENVNKLSQLYLLGKQTAWKYLITDDDKIWKLVLSDEMRSAKASRYAQEIFDKINEDYLENYWEEDDEWNPTNEEEYEFPDEIKEQAKRYYNELNDSEKREFEEELRDKLENENFEENEIDYILDEIKQDDIIPWEEKVKQEEAEKKDVAFDNARNAIEWKWDFEEWTRIVIKTQDSKLPPNDIKDSYFVFEICDISGPKWEWTFSVKAIWNEIPLANPWKVYPWLPYTAEQLERMAKSGTVYRMPKRTWNSREDCKKTILNSKTVSKFTAFGNMEDQVELKWSKFVNKEWEEIKYFSRMEDKFDPEWNKPWKEISKYEIKKINHINGTVTISSTFEWVDDDNGEAKAVNFKYENTLPFEQFILLIESKKLKWYTKEQQEERDTQYDTDKQWRLPGRWKLNWVSIGNFISVFKAHWKKIKDKYKEMQQEQEETLENFLLSKEWLDLYKHMWNIMSLWGLLGDVKNAFGEAEIEYYNDRDNKTWKKIDRWYKHYGSDPMYPAEFNDFLVPLLSKWWYRGDKKDRYKFAAAVLIMLKKEWPYPRNFISKKWEWYRVEAFLWEWHKTRFQNFYKKKQQEINEVKDMGYASWIRLKKKDELNKMEFQYIIAVISGDEPYKSGDSDAQKSIWSNKFKDELQANLDGYFNKHESEKSDLKWKSFTEAETAFLDKMAKWVDVKALAALEYMCENANTPNEVFRVKWYLLSAMLMWLIGSTNDGTPKSFWKTGRTMWFCPLSAWGRDTNAAEKVQKLLDWLGGLEIKIQNFSNFTKYNLHDFTPPTISRKYEDFNKKFQEYWKINGKNILKYVENPVYGGDNSIDKIAQNKENPLSPIFWDLKKAYEDPDLWNTNSEVKNPILYIKEAPLTASYNIIRKYMPNKWIYKTEKEEDLWDARDLWTSIATQVNSGKQHGEDFVFYMKYYNKLFGLSQINTTELIRTISLIKILKANGKMEEAKYIRRYMFEWKMHKDREGSFPPEFQKCHDAFSTFFYENIEKMDAKTMKDVFGTGADDDFKNPYKMVNRKERNNKIWVNDPYTQKTWNYKKELRTKWFEDDNIINSQIQTLRKTISKTCPVKKANKEVLDSEFNINFDYDDKDVLNHPYILEWATSNYRDKR